MAPITNCISEISNTKIYHAEDNDVVMPMYNLIDYSDNYLKTSGSLWQYYRDRPDINNNSIVIDFPDNTASALFKTKQKITGQTGNDGTKNDQIMAPLKHLSSF